MASKEVTPSSEVSSFSSSEEICKCWMCYNIDSLPLKTSVLKFQISEINMKTNTGTISIIADKVCCISFKIKAHEIQDGYNYKCLNLFLLRLPKLKEFTSNLKLYDEFTGDPVRFTIDVNSIPNVTKIKCDVPPLIIGTLKEKEGGKCNLS